MADLKASMDVTDTSLDGHSHAIVIAYAHPSTQGEEPGTDWIRRSDTTQRPARHECASVITNYLRTLGYQAEPQPVNLWGVPETSGGSRRTG